MGKTVLFVIKQDSMSRPDTFRKEGWLNNEPTELSLFSQGFPHDHLAIFKIAQKTQKVGFSLDSYFKQRDGRISSLDQLRVWLPFRQGRTICGLLRGDAFKLHYDHGSFSSHNHQFNWYGDIRGKRNLDALGGKLGVAIKRSNWSTNLRLAVVDYCSYIQNKTSFTQDNLSFEIINSYDIKHREWKQSNVQFVHSFDNWKFIFQAAGHNHSKVKFNRFLENINAAVIWTSGQHKFGLRLKGDIRENDVDQLETVWEYRPSENAAVKVRADGARNVAASIKTPIEKWGSWTLGVNIADFGHANTFSYGLQVDLEL